MNRPVLRALAVKAVALIAVFSAPAYADGESHRFVVFGDSLSDPGNFFIEYGQVSEPPYEPVPSAPYDIHGHHFSNGPTWIEQLTEELGSRDSGRPALERPGVYTNYAMGRARARANAPVFLAFDLSTQVGLFLNDFGGQAPAHATYVIWIGANDLDDAIGALQTDPSGATSIGIIQTALGTIAANIQALWAAGARSFLIPNEPDLGLTPAVQVSRSRCRRRRYPAQRGIRCRTDPSARRAAGAAANRVQDARRFHTAARGGVRSPGLSPEGCAGSVPDLLRLRGRHLRAAESAPVLGWHSSDRGGP